MVRSFVSVEHLFMNGNDNCHDLCCDDNWLGRDSTNMVRHFDSVEHLFVNANDNWHDLGYNDKLGS